jgi:hypothetical protein
MKGLPWFLLLVLTVAPLDAKPKVDVRVTVTEEVAKQHASDKLGMGNASATNLLYSTVFYMNVTVLSDNAAAVTKGNGQWCLSGDETLRLNEEYHGTLDGNDLYIEVPGKNGKPRKLHLEVYDHKWRKLSDIS